MKIIIFIFFIINSISLYASEFDPELKNYSYPFPVQYFDIEAQGQKLQMAYMDLRPIQPNGKTYVLLHGKNFGGFYFKDIAELALAKGYRVIIPDQIGFGKSTKPASFQYSFHLLSLFTNELLISLQIPKFNLLTHSMGGMLGTRMSLMYPEKIEKLTMVCPIGLEDYRILVPYKRVDDVYESELKVTAESIKNYQRANYYSGNWKPEYDKLIEPASGQTRHKDFSLVAKNSALTFDMIYTQPVVYEFKNIKVDTTLIIGLNDKTAPGRPSAKPEDQIKLGDYTQLGKQAQKLIPKSKLIELKGRGHVPFIEDWNGFKKILSPVL